MAEKKQFRIGIVGGMGPRSSLLLEERIIEATPATTDQEHLEVLHFSNPHIPNRTESLARDGGASFVKEIIKAAQTVERAGATIIVIPCHTTHARFEAIEKAVRVPVMNMVKETLSYIAETFPHAKRIGLIATDGTVRERVFERWLPHPAARILTPATASQKRTMEIIIALKAGAPPKKAAKELRLVITELDEAGAEVVVLGCTDLSILVHELQSARIPLIDPLYVVAGRLVAAAETANHRSFYASTQTRLGPHRRPLEPHPRRTSASLALLRGSGSHRDSD